MLIIGSIPEHQVVRYTGDCHEDFLFPSTRVNSGRQDILHSQLHRMLAEQVAVLVVADFRWWRDVHVSDEEAILTQTRWKLSPKRIASTFYSSLQRS